MKNLPTTPENLALGTMVFVDRHGNVTSKNGSPVAKHLNMTYIGVDIIASFKVFQSAQGNGGCSVEVKYKNELVLACHGTYVANPYNIKIETYLPGEWETIWKDGLDIIKKKY